MNTNKLARNAMIAALYVAATVIIAPASYGLIQCRLSEILTLLAYVNPMYIPGLVVGCAISNIWSPLGFLDVIVGTTATFLCVYMMSKTKNLLLATLWSMANCIFVSFELYFVMKIPIWLSMLSIAISEFVVVTCIGYPLFRFLLSNRRIMDILNPRSRP